MSKFIGIMRYGDFPAMRTGIFIYNPDSGRQMIPDILDELLVHGIKKGIYLIPFRLHPSTENRDLLVKLIVEPWVDFLIVSGGDGTLGSVARLVLEQRPSLPMGVVPSGTCNDFAESLNMPVDEWECVSVAADNITQALDVGKVNGEGIFLSTCAAGMFVNISYSVGSQLKRNFGPLAYYISALGELPNIRPFHLKIETDTETVEDNFLLFLLLNGSRAAGLADLYPQTSMTDGFMDLLLIRDVPPFDIPNLLIEIFNRKNVEEGRWIKRLSSNRFIFTSEQAILSTQDGEEGLPLPLEVEVLPRALNVYIPGSDL
jgi:YegS/Rv2252/BmrU family lipid kinase